MALLPVLPLVAVCNRLVPLTPLRSSACMTYRSQCRTLVKGYHRLSRLQVWLQQHTKLHTCQHLEDMTRCLGTLTQPWDSQSLFAVRAAILGLYLSACKQLRFLQDSPGDVALGCETTRSILTCSSRATLRHSHASSNSASVAARRTCSSMAVAPGTLTGSMS
jgi:hypothetical protein